jgi:hypothetical protein
MLHLSPSQTARRAVLSVLPLAAKRTAIAGLESAWVAATETDAARHARMDDRATWDKSTWVRYLAATAVHEPRFKPRIMRLLREISSIETGLTMPTFPDKHQHDPCSSWKCRSDSGCRGSLAVAACSATIRMVAALPRLKRSRTLTCCLIQHAPGRCASAGGGNGADQHGDKG